MDLTQRLNKIAAEKQLSSQGKAAQLLSLAAFVLLDKNNDIIFDADDLPGTVSRLATAGSSNGVVDLEGSGDPSAAVTATLSTNLTGTNNDLVFTAVPVGADGNLVTIEYVNPGTANHALAIAIASTVITITLATNGSSVITTIASAIAALNFGGLVTVANKAANDGTGVVTAMAATALSGGSNATGDGTAGKGSRYTNYAAGTLWINTGTTAAPVWVRLATV